MRAFAFACGLIALTGTAVGQPIIVLPPNATQEQILRESGIVGLALVANGEAMCGLTYKGGAVEAQIAKDAPKDDGTFAADLQKRIASIAKDYKKWPKGYMTTLCEQLTDLAKSEGLID